MTHSSTTPQIAPTFATPVQTHPLPPDPDALQSPNGAFKAIYTELLALQETVKRLQSRIEALEAHYAPPHP